MIRMRKLLFMFGLFLLSGAAQSAEQASEEQPLAPEFTLQSLAGGELSLSDFRGKLVLLNFWATWCMPCRQEMPSMEQLWQKYQNQGLVILAVSTDEGGPKRVQNFVKKLKLSFPVALDPDSKVSDVYQVSGLPVSYLVDREGHLLAEITGSEDWMSEKALRNIESLLSAD